MRHHALLVVGILFTAAVLVGPSAGDTPMKIDVLKIGATSALGGNVEQGQEETARDTFRRFIKDETGYSSDVQSVDNWSILGDQLAAKKVHLGVFLGQEFAWAKAKNPKLRPLAIAVNTYPYRYAYLVVNQGSKATDFASLQGTTIGLPKIGLSYLRVWLDGQSRAAGKEAEAFFAKVPLQENVELTLDDLIDGKLDAAIVDRVGLEGYMRRKPGRASGLKQLAQSEPLIPALVAYQEGGLDSAAQQRILDGVAKAEKKKDGQRLLSLFRLSAFQAVPKDFDAVLAESLKKYPAPAPLSK
jgi:ABC-type phosphate/phosphonate transport system substrate-binding protein